MHENRTAQMRVAHQKLCSVVSWVILVQIMVVDLVQIVCATTRPVVECMWQPRLTLVHGQKRGVILSLHMTAEPYKSSFVEDGILHGLFLRLKYFCRILFTTITFRLLVRKMVALVLDLGLQLAHPIVEVQNLEVQPQLYGLAITRCAVMNH